MVSSTVVMYLQPALLGCANELATPPLSTMHFSGYNAGSYTAIALETDCRLLFRHFQQSCCEGTTTVGALGCPVRYLIALLTLHLHASGTNLVSASSPHYTWVRRQTLRLASEIRHTWVPIPGCL